MDTGKVVAKLPTGSNPNEVAVSPDGFTAAISDMGPRPQDPGKTLTLVDLKTWKICKTVNIEPHSMPHGITWVSNKRIGFTSHTTDSVVEVDVESSGNISRAIQTEQKGTHLAVFNPDFTKSYAVNAFSGSVSAIDFKSGKVIKQIPTGARAEGISISPDGKWVACGNLGSNDVSIISTDSNAITHTIPKIGGPIRTIFTKDGKHLAVSSIESGSLEVYETGKWTKVASVELKQKPIANPQYGTQWPIPMNLALRKNGNLLVVLVTSHAVAEVDTKTWKVVKTFDTGGLPDGIAVSEP
jgi:YVTN family beta-propeller protein